MKGRLPSARRNAIAERAGVALQALLGKQNCAKRVAQLFKISPRHAQHLIAGRSWTVERLSDASMLLGWEFDEIVLPRPRVIDDSLTLDTEPAASSCDRKVSEHLDRIEAELIPLLREIGEDLADEKKARDEFYKRLLGHWVPRAVGAAVWLCVGAVSEAGALAAPLFWQ